MLNSVFKSGRKDVFSPLSCRSHSNQMRANYRNFSRRVARLKYFCLGVNGLAHSHVSMEMAWNRLIKYIKCACVSMYVSARTGNPITFPMPCIHVILSIFHTVFLCIYDAHTHFLLRMQTKEKTAMNVKFFISSFLLFYFTRSQFIESVCTTSERTYNNSNLTESE